MFNFVKYKVNWFSSRKEHFIGYKCSKYVAIPVLELKSPNNIIRISKVTLMDPISLARKS